MLTTDALINAIAALPYPSIEDHRRDRAKHTEAVKAYREQERALRDQWQAWLADEYAPAGLPSKRQRDLIFAKAWDHQHADGYRAVEHEYEDLSDFLTKILAG